MTTARVIDTHRLSILAHEYEREIVQFFHDLAGPAERIAERIRQEAERVPFEEVRTGSTGNVVARLGAGKHTIMMEAHNAAGMAGVLYAGKLIHELGMYGDFTLWVGQWSPQDSFVRPDCVVIAEPTNLCIGMREGALEGFLSEADPLVQAAIAAYETLFELPPIVSRSPSPKGAIGIPAIAFGPGENQEPAPVRHLLNSAQFYAAFPVMYVDMMKQR